VRRFGIFAVALIAGLVIVKPATLKSISESVQSAASDSVSA
jgi:hypothetical protein